MQWTESIVVDRPAVDVHGAIADENALMNWSAWPAATGYTCTEQGRQTLTAASNDRIEYRLRNRGPAGRDITPEVDFRLEDLSVGQTRVHLDFRRQ